MTWTDFKLRLRALLFRGRVESELDEELQFHLAMQARIHLAVGADVLNARLDARAQFGGLQKTN